MFYHDMYSYQGLGPLAAYTKRLSITGWAEFTPGVDSWTS